MARSYFKSGIVELEAPFADNQNSTQVLRDLDDELVHRSTNRAKRLHAKVKEAIEKQQTVPTPEPINPPPSEPRTKSQRKRKTKESPEPEEPAPETGQTGQQPERAGHSWEEIAERDFPLPAGPPSLPPITNRPEQILSAWLAWEVLSPQTFRRPEDLADGERRRVADYEKGPLPWEGTLENSRPNTRLYYQVVLGAARMDRATRLLLRAFENPRPERPEPRDFAALAIVTADREGKPVEEGSVTISSFGWALPYACRRDLEDLKNWPNTSLNSIGSSPKN